MATFARALALLAGLAAAAATGPALADTAAERALEWNERGVRLSEEGRLDEAVRAFEKARAEAPGDAVILRNLALARANWGVRLLSHGDAVAAEIQTRSARDLLPEDPVIRLNLAACLEERGYPARAAEEVRRGLELGPELPLAHERMGTVHQREGRLSEAVAEWRRAVALGSREGEIQARLARAEAMLRAEERLTKQTSAHFEALFDLERDAVLASNVLRELEEAHGVVGAELQHFGRDRLRVVLLPTEEFQAVTGAHAWIGGLYDGEIRLPVKGAGGREGEILARARHEYVHAVLAALGKRAPAWLHEGLAQIHEGRSVAQAIRRLAGSPALPFECLSRSFAATADQAEARRQYDTALAFVAWLREGEPSGAFRAAMSALFEDATLEDAFEGAYGLSLPRLYEKGTCSTK